jgi:hypothetical protein
MDNNKVINTITKITLLITKNNKINKYNSTHTLKGETWTVQLKQLTTNTTCTCEMTLTQEATTSGFILRSPMGKRDKM